jgi:hypothetical protein
MQRWLSVDVERGLLAAALLWMVLGGWLFGPTDSTYKILYGVVLGFLFGVYGGRTFLGPCSVRDTEP